MPKFALLTLLLSACGCATVQPWEKAMLAEPQMRFAQKNPGRFFLEHAQITVEQAEGGNGRAGGGCGCR